jgi:hypothetical protein
VHDRNPVHDGKHTALASEDAVADLVALRQVIRRGDEVEAAALADPGIPLDSLAGELAAGG